MSLGQRVLVQKSRNPSQEHIAKPMHVTPGSQLEVSWFASNGTLFFVYVLTNDRIDWFLNIFNNKLQRIVHVQRRKVVDFLAYEL